ncbi:MAG: SAM-dependent chlorinase/fluorinase, partial [Fibrobacter sp.]|nr:SAM-dependent chlorinase/fluorinase [Fibrobacter sp.]
MYPLIALLTDFGTQDWFTAEMKAVIHGIAPQSTVLDISHAVQPGDIRSAAFILNACYKSFPAKSIFCISVDATEDICPAIIVHCDDHFFIASDNGILSWITNGKQFQVWHIKNKVFFHSSKPTTFRGRDVLGPVAAHLSRGITPERFGCSATTIQTINIPTPVFISSNVVEGEIIYIDHFGNAITTI